LWIKIKGIWVFDMINARKFICFFYKTNYCFERLHVIVTLQLGIDRKVKQLL